MKNDFNKALIEIKQSNINKISFKSKIKDFVDIYVIWEIVKSKKGNQLYFVSATFNKKFWTFLSNLYWIKNFSIYIEYKSISEYELWLNNLVKELFEIRKIDFVSLWFEKEKKVPLESDIFKTNKTQNLKYYPRDEVIYLPQISNEDFLNILFENLEDCSLLKRYIISFQSLLKYNISWLSFAIDNKLFQFSIKGLESFSYLYKEFDEIWLTDTEITEKFSKFDFFVKKNWILLTDDFSLAFLPTYIDINTIKTKNSLQTLSIDEKEQIIYLNSHLIYKPSFNKNEMFKEIKQKLLSEKYFNTNFLLNDLSIL